MSIAELEMETKTFAEKLTNEELAQAEEILDEIRLARRCDEIWARIESGETKLVPHEEVRAMVNQHFARV